MVTVPASIRRRLDVEAGDSFRWTVTEEGELTEAVVRRRYGAFDDFEAVPMGGDTQEPHDLAGHEDAPAFAVHS